MSDETLDVGGHSPAKNWIEHALIDGPSVWDLAVALFDKGPLYRRVKFKTGQGFAPRSVEPQDTRVSFEVVIQGIERQDANGESWFIKGYAYEFSGLARSPKPPQDVKISFHTGQRKGTLRIDF